MKFVAGLTCHLCGAMYPPEALWVCTDCLGPLEVSYDYAAVRGAMTRALILHASGPRLTLDTRPRPLFGPRTASGG